MTDGLTGTINFRDGRWMGFSGTDAVVEIDLGEEQMISKVGINFFEYGNAWILSPKQVTMFISSDGEKWKELYSTQFDINPEGSEKDILRFEFHSAGLHRAHFIKVVAENAGPLPEWHDAAGSDSWIFVDEIIVR